MKYASIRYLDNQVLVYATEVDMSILINVQGFAWGILMTTVDFLRPTIHLYIFTPNHCSPLLNETSIGCLFLSTFGNRNLEMPNSHSDVLLVGSSAPSLPCYTTILLHKPRDILFICSPFQLFERSYGSLINQCRLVLLLHFRV